MRRTSMVACSTLLVLALAVPAPASAVTACSRGTVALTFDDGPHGTHTPKVLDVLARKQAKGTFFQVGSQVARRPAITRRAHAEGHRIANHTNAHERLTSLSDRGIRDTLTRANTRITNAGAAKPTLVRPPGGATNSRVRNVISGMGMRQVMWNIDPQDWRPGRSASSITSLVLANLRDGGNILLHDGVTNSGATVTALPRIIDGVRARGFCIGTLSSTGKVVPPRPAVRIGDVEVTEGAAGTRITAYLPVTLSEPTSRAVSVGYTTVDGTALAGSDYRATSGTLTIPVGTTRARIAVRVLGDDLVEKNEKLYVELSEPSGVRVKRGTALVRILDDD